MGALHETMTTANPLAGPSPLRDVINPQFHQINFSVEPYIKNDLGVKLDKGGSR
jgi:cleavage and polyadenylation specificity factor subunit 4